MIFKRCKSLAARLYEIVDFRDEMTPRNRLFTKSPFRCDFIQQKWHFVQATEKGLHTSFLPPKFAPESNIKTYRTMKRQINIDYIGVVRKEKENYLYEEREIIANQELIDKLQAILEDDTKSILDMQTACTRRLAVHRNPCIVWCFLRTMTLPLWYLLSTPIL